MNQNYASLLDRAKAVFIDAIIIITAMYAATEIFEAVGEVPIYVKIITFVFLFVIYDPLCISLWGATLGHSYADIKVVKEKGKGNIHFFIAVVRYGVKFALGWLSFFTITMGENKKAVHDYIAETVVIKTN